MQNLIYHCTTRIRVFDSKAPAVTYVAQTNRSETPLQTHYFTLTNMLTGEMVSITRGLLEDRYVPCRQRALWHKRQANIFGYAKRLQRRLYKSLCSMFEMKDCEISCAPQIDIISGTLTGKIILTIRLIPQRKTIYFGISNAIGEFLIGEINFYLNAHLPKVK